MTCLIFMTAFCRNLKIIPEWNTSKRVPLTWISSSQPFWPFKTFCCKHLTIRTSHFYFKPLINNELMSWFHTNNPVVKNMLFSISRQYQDKIKTISVCLVLNKYVKQCLHEYTDFLLSHGTTILAVEIQCYCISIWLLILWKCSKRNICQLTPWKSLGLLSWGYLSNYTSLYYQILTFDFTLITTGAIYWWRLFLVYSLNVQCVCTCDV